jgi:prepilin-type processing-associated H-X9-DG protein
MAPRTEAWLPDLSTLYPQYLTDISLLISPLEPSRRSRKEMNAIFASEPIDWVRANGIFSENYAYIGWAVTNSAQLKAAQEERIHVSKTTSAEPMRLRTSDGENNVYPLRMGIERFFITHVSGPINTSIAKQAEIPVMIDIAGIRRKPTGAHVLYMDGHVEFLQFG